MNNCDVPVDDVPLVTTTNIGSFGASSCKFFLLTGIYQDQHFAYLDHDVVHYEGSKVLDVLYSVLDFTAKKLEQYLIGSSSKKTLADLNDIYLIFGGGEQKRYDVLRLALSLMIAPDDNAQNQAKTFFHDIHVNILYDKLVNHVIILKSVSYVMSDADEEAAKKVEDPGEVINPPSLALYYDCVIDRGYIAIEWGKCSNLIHLAYMLFGLRATQKAKLEWNIAYDQIERIKKAFGDQSLDQSLLEKALEYISDGPVFDTDSDLPL